MSSLTNCKFHFWALFLAVSSCLVSLSAEETFTERSSSKEFPTSIEIQNLGRTYKLQATGAAVRRKWFIKGYVIAHYMEDPVKGDQDTVLKDVFSNDKAKQLTMYWLHRLPLQLVKEGYTESLVKVLKDNELAQLQPDIDKYISFFTKDSEEGDVHKIKWLPGGHIEVIVNDKKVGGFVNPELAKAMWMMWFGPDSVVNRKALIKRVTMK